MTMKKMPMTLIRKDIPPYIASIENANHVTMQYVLIEHYTRRIITTAIKGEVRGRGADVLNTYNILDFISNRSIISRRLFPYFEAPRNKQRGMRSLFSSDRYHE